MLTNLFILVQYRETVTMRLILKHLRRRRYKAYQALLDETGLSIEHPLVSSLYETLVVQGDLARAEEIFISFAASGLLDVPSRARSVPTCSKKYGRPSTIWRRITDTNADGGTPCARGGHASVMDPERGIIYIFGGWDGSQDLADFWAYSTSEQRWTTLSIDTSAKGEGGPSARSCVAAAFDNRTGDIYFLGRYILKPTSSQSYSQTSMAGNSGEESIGARTPGTTALPRVRRMRVSTGGGTPTPGTAGSPTVVYAAPRSPQETLTALTIPSSRQAGIFSLVSMIRDSFFSGMSQLTLLSQPTVPLSLLPLVRRLWLQKERVLTRARHRTFIDIRREGQTKANGNYSVGTLR
jgi:Kelch motif